MKTKLAAIFAITAALLCSFPSRAQQSQQPLKHFGYFGATSDPDLAKVRSYTDFTYVDGVYGQSIVDQATRVRNNGMRVVIDLGKVLWCPQDPNNPFGAWHLCNNSEVNYTTRWYNWISMNGSVLNGNYVLAFSVITEPALRSISTADVETAVALVKQTYWQIPTLVADASISIDQNYQVPYNADWVGIAAYYTHPNLDGAFTNSVALLKQKKQSWQKTAYTLDAFYGPSHHAVAPTAADMDTIAQEWYTIASKDSDAILLAAFLWPDLPSEGAIGSISFPQNVLDKHAAIGSAILAGRFPTYQGTFDRIDCQSLAGWAWDASEPNTPISVDIYDGWQKIATVRANQFRQDLVNAGIGNGQHGFSFNLPASLRNGQNHWVLINYSGLDQGVNLNPRSITCTAPPVYEGWVDSADCNSIVGWAADRSRLNTSITVGIYDNYTLVSTVLANQPRGDVGSYLGDNGLHGFTIPTPPNFKDGLPHTLRVKFESSATELGSSPRTLTCAVTNASASIAWIRPAENSWGPANTMTVAGYAQNGSGGVQLVWRDVTIGGSWNVVAWQPSPNPADNGWSNTIPSAYRCHTFSAYVNYSGVQSPMFTYNGLNSGYCNESARVIWIQPQWSAGFGPPGSLVIAGSASNAPSGTQVYLSYRDATAGTGWTQLDFAPPPGSDGIWYNSIPNANFYHQYQVKVTYDVITSSTCTYAGNNSATTCP